jgi:hypothetical protein
MIDSFNRDLRRKEAEDVAADLRDDAIMHEEARLLREEFNPMTPENFAEAMRELFSTDHANDHAHAILTLISEGKGALVESYVTGMSQGYWRAQAYTFSRKDL